MIRRYTGGGTVVTDKNTVFATFIMNGNDVPAKPYPRDIMAWSESDVFGPVFTTSPPSTHTTSIMPDIDSTAVLQVSCFVSLFVWRTILFWKSWV